MYGIRPQKVTIPWSHQISTDVEILAYRSTTATLNILHSIFIETDNHTDLFCKML